MKRKIFALISIFFLISVICVKFISRPSESPLFIRQDNKKHPNLAINFAGTEKYCDNRHV